MHTSPDFNQWATNIAANKHAETIAAALKQAFNQGYYLGVRDGTEKEQNEWWILQDKDVTTEERDGE